MNVVIATPLGREGKGGIDRIMDAVANELAIHPIPGLHHCFIITRGQRSALFSVVQLPLAISRLIAMRAAGRVDLVHINLSSHGSTSRKIILAAVCRRLNIPYIIHLHGSRMRQYWLNVPLGRRAKIVAMFSGAAHVLVLGGVWHKFVMEHAPAAAGRITILPNATRKTELAHVSGQNVRILFLGRIGERKGVPQLIDALAKLPRNGGWCATIAGDGDVESAQKQIIAAGLESFVSLPGWVGPEDVERALANADILVLPSFDENLPMSVIEGMAAGLAIIATPVGATEDIIHQNETGLLVPPGDVDALAAALNQLVADEVLRKSLGNNARSYHSAHLEITNYVKQIAAIWQSTVNKSEKI